MRQTLIILFIFISFLAFGQKHLIGIEGGLNFTNSASEVVFDRYLYCHK